MKNTKKILKEISSWIFIILAAFCIALVFDSTVFAQVTVRHSSMEDTLYEGQKLVVNNLYYNNKAPQRGDVITFFQSKEKGNMIDCIIRSAGEFMTMFDEDKETDRLVKRVIGIPGDTIDIKDGYVYVNGEKQKEAYVKGITEKGEIQLPVTVGENQLFVMGDNREVSLDSRDIGLIDYKQIEGKVMFRLFPFNKMGKVK